MRNERARRRPGFCPGIDLRLADGQVWSLPVPGEETGNGQAALEAGDSGATWDDRCHGAIIQSLVEAEGEGDAFRAKLALAIHLLNWNYRLEPDDLEDLLDDRGEIRRRADVSQALNRLAMAHLRPFIPPADGHPGGVPDPVGGNLRGVLGQHVSLIVGRRAIG